MSINPYQFRKFIKAVLMEFNSKLQPKPRPSFDSEDAIELLMLTAAQETHLGKYLWQVHGPALGVFQMEPKTYSDLWSRFICYRQDLLDRFNDMYGASGIPWELRMKGDLVYQILMTRIYYLQIPAKIPFHQNVEAMAIYYKRYYNTPLGKASVEEAIKNYKQFCF